MLVSKKDYEETKNIMKELDVIKERLQKNGLSATDLEVAYVLSAYGVDLTDEQIEECYKIIASVENDILDETLGEELWKVIDK